MRYFTAVILAGIMAFFMVAAWISPVSAESLWKDNPRSIFSDRKAGRVGDILTIIISESASTSQSKATSNSKSGKQTLNAGTGIFGFLAAASASGSDSFKADGSTSNTNKATGTVTVTIVEVKDNGNYVIEGTQSIWNNNNEHRITLRGIVRPDDITYNNTISSTKVADATLKFDGKGPLNSKQRQGILTQIFNILF